MTDLDELKGWANVWHETCEKQKAELATLKAENERLREALRPFAKIKYKDRKLGAVAPRGDRETETVEIQLRFLRRARAELAKGGKGDDH